MDETQKIFDTYEKIAEQYAVFTKFKPNNVHLERLAVRALLQEVGEALEARARRKLRESLAPFQPAA